MPLVILNPPKPPEPARIEPPKTNLPAPTRQRPVQTFQRPARQPSDGPMLVVGGREKKISGSSAYLLDMLTTD